MLGEETQAQGVVAAAVAPRTIDLGKRRREKRAPGVLRQRLAQAKRAFTTRRVDLSLARGLLSKGVEPKAGDLVLARVTAVGHHRKIELIDGRRSQLYIGDEVIVAYNTYNVEAAYMRGPFSLQSEYSVMDVRRIDRPDPKFRSGYVMGSWVITGEERNYSRSNGTLGGVDLRRGRQAFEVAARYSFADLDSETVTGGTEKNWSFGATWYINQNVRVMGNYVHAVADPNRNGRKEELEILQARIQLTL